VKVDDMMQAMLEILPDLPDDTIKAMWKAMKEAEKKEAAREEPEVG